MHIRQDEGTKYKICVPSMIHSVRPTAPPVMTAIVTFSLFFLGEILNLKSGTDGLMERLTLTLRVKVVITTVIVGRPCGYNYDIIWF